MGTRVSPPSSKAVVEIADGLVERYTAAGWTVQGSPAEPVEKPKADTEKKAVSKAARRSK